jgi:hypothetical protein
MCTRTIYCADDGHQTQGLMPAASHFPSPGNETVRKQKGYTFFKTTLNEQASSPGQFKSKTSKAFHLSPKSSASEAAANSHSFSTMICPLSCTAPKSHSRPLPYCQGHLSAHLTHRNLYIYNLPTIHRHYIIYFPSPLFCQAKVTGL